MTTTQTFLYCFLVGWTLMVGVHAERTLETLEPSAMAMAMASR